jgi:hypothetical protein
MATPSGLFDPGVRRHHQRSGPAGHPNTLNRRLKEGLSRQVTFESIRPAARFVGRGLILPRKDRLTVPIEAVNLRSLQVAAFQIYPGNMAQFFQVNSLEGSDELARVGRYLWRKTVPLSDDPSATGRWSRYDLDVTPLFRESPGSLFRIVLSFNRGNSTYPCPASDKPVVTEAPLRNLDDAGYDRYSNWDYAEESYVYDSQDWFNRDNPCFDAYYLPRYNHAAVAGRNFFASDIGLVAKLEANGGLHVVTTDLGTARPVSGLRVRAFNYQNQLLGETTSDGNGFAFLGLEDRPFYVSAEGGGDTGYLRIAGEGVLPMSHFDVGGETTEKGVKALSSASAASGGRGHPLSARPVRSGEGLPAGHRAPEIAAPGAARPDAKPDDRRAFLRVPRRNGRDGAHGELASPGPRRRPDLQQDPQDRDRRAQPAQDPARPGPQVWPQGHAVRRRSRQWLHGPAVT